VDTYGVKVPDFVATNAPKMVELGKPAPRPSRRVEETVLERYFGTDFRPIYQDIEARPAHYTAEHHTTASSLRQGRKVPARQQNDLVYQFLRQTEAQKKEKEARRAVTSAEMPEKPAAFEDQDDLKGAIILI
jgi:hypothetical protein